jgi:hypothetical protein
LPDALGTLLSLRGCTLQTLAFWVDKFLIGGETANWNAVYVKKSWLKEGNISLLTRFLTQKLLAFPITPRGQRLSTNASIKDAALLFLNDSVDIEWLLTLKRWYDPMRQSPRFDAIVANGDVSMLWVMSLDRNLTLEMIEHVFPCQELRGNYRAQALFESESVPVIRFLLSNGFAPTAKQLTVLSGMKVGGTKEVDTGV